MPSAGPGGKGGAARGTQWLLRPAWPCCLPAATAAPWERRCSRGRRRGEADGTLAAVLRLRCKSQIIPDGNFVCKHGANTNKQTRDRNKRKYGPGLWPQGGEGGGHVSWGRASLQEEPRGQKREPEATPVGES